MVPHQEAALVLLDAAAALRDGHEAANLALGALFDRGLVRTEIVDDVVEVELAALTNGALLLIGMLAGQLATTAGVDLDAVLDRARTAIGDPSSS